VFKIAHQHFKTADRQLTATILCDSRSALQAVQSARNRSGQRIVHAILQAGAEVLAAGIALRLQWVPGHCDNPGNDAADRLAKDAASPSFPPAPHQRESVHPSEHLLSVGTGMEIIYQGWSLTKDR
jgi:ribonuclease HI